MPAPARFDWATDELRRRLDPVLPGIRVEVAASIGSTNSALVERARQGDHAPCLLVAEEQTAGRGRAGRPWHCRPGASLTFSLSTRLDDADWSGLSLAVGLALAEALDPPGTAGRWRIGLKWPNDLMLCGVASDAAMLPRKLGGILIESVIAGGARVAVIGIGLNIAQQALPDLPLGQAWLQELHAGLTAPDVLANVVGPIAIVTGQFAQTGFAPLAARYAERDLLAGRAVSTSVGDGTAEGVDRDGALRLRAADRVLRVTSGEVSVRLVATGAQRAQQEAAC